MEIVTYHPTLAFKIGQEVIYMGEYDNCINRIYTITKIYLPFYYDIKILDYTNFSYEDGVYSEIYSVTHNELRALNYIE